MNRGSGFDPRFVFDTDAQNVEQIVLSESSCSDDDWQCKDDRSEDSISHGKPHFERSLALFLDTNRF
jgi:hypothetical protein